MGIESKKFYFENNNDTHNTLKINKLSRGLKLVKKFILYLSILWILISASIILGLSNQIGFSLRENSNHEHGFQVKLKNGDYKNATVIERIGRVGGWFLHGLAVGDLDEDGVNEIVVGEGRGKVRIYGFNGFEYVDEYSFQSSSARPYGMAIGDLTGDGKLELSIGDFSSNKISVINWDGSQYVETHQIDCTGRNLGMDIGDADNDGTLELVVGSGAGSSDYSWNGVVHIFQWNGTNFIEETSYDLGDRIYGIAVGDTDNDGLNEVFYGEEENVILLKYNGDIWQTVFSIPLSFYEGWNVEICDVNNDEINELLFGDNVNIYSWDGSSYIEQASLFSQWVYGVSIACGDVDADDQNELFVTKYTGGESSVYMYKWNGTNYSLEWELTLETTLIDQGNVDAIDWFQGISIEDTDNDDINELIIASAYGNVHIFSWDGTTFVEDWKGNMGRNAYGMCVADCDNDGFSEVVAGGFFGFFNIFSFENGIFNEDWKGHVGNYSFGNAYGIACDDIDRDGQKEIIICGEKSDIHVYKYVNNEYIKLWNTTLSSYEWGHLYERVTNNVAAGDVDGDGFNDFIVGDNEGIVHVFRWNGLSFDEITSVMAGEKAYKVVIGDIDNDSINEIIAGTTSGIVYIYSWDGSLLQLESTINSFDLRAWGIGIGDADNDSVVEIIVGNSSGFVRMYSWDGNQYIEEWSGDIGADAFGVLVADFDKDNLNELVLGNGEGEIKFLKWATNDFSQIVSVDVGTNTYSFDFGDIDNDGNVELIAGNEEGDILVLRPSLDYPQYTLTISSGIGGTTDPAPGDYIYYEGSEVTINAISSAGYAFSDWSGDIVSIENPITITVDGNKSITAHFIREYSLTINSGTGGTTNPSPGDYAYDEGTEVEIEAIPDTMCRFTGWSGDVPSGHEHDNPITINMDSDKSVTANFVQQYSLVISTGEGGTTDPWPGIFHRYDSGAEVTIEALPDTNYGFSHWSGDVPSGSENDNPLTLIMNTSRQITANFVKIRCKLTIVARTGGTTHPGPGDYMYNTGTIVSIEAIPYKEKLLLVTIEYKFDRWIGNVPADNQKDNPILITVDSDKSITANFEKISVFSEGKGCFIATAAYGSPLHPYIKILREFRDKYIMPSRLGREFVDLYYRYSPFAANLIEKHKALRIMVQVNLFPFIMFCYSMVYFGPLVTGIIIFLIVILPVLFMLLTRRS